MQETHHLSLSPSTPKLPKFPPKPKPKPNLPKFPSPPNHDFPSLSIKPNPKHPHPYHDLPSIPTTRKSPSHFSKSPNYPSKPQPKPKLKPNPQLPQDFHSKLIFLDSLGLDFLSLITSHPPLLHTPLSTLTSAASFLLSPSAAALSATDLRRAVATCPEILTLSVRAHLGPALAFLLREARVPHSLLPRAVSRRPRLLSLSVPARLRPALMFLHSIGIHSLHLHTNLLTSSVEDKLIPRIHYFQNLGFTHREAISLFRRFPQLFCYSIR